MSTFLRKSIAFGRYRVPALLVAETSDVRYSLRWFSVSSSDQKQSFSVSYLISSLGFSPKAALSFSRSTKFDSAEKPDKIIELFRGCGFTQTQISSLVRRSPRTLVSDAEKVILPKLEFLKSKGISGPELANSLSVYPTVLRSSLARKIVPSYEFLRSLVRSEDMIVKALRQFPCLLACSVENHLSPNVDTLRRHGVPNTRVGELISSFPQVLLTGWVQLEGFVKEVLEMGFEPSKYEFIQALYAVHQKKRKVRHQKKHESRWAAKVAAYQKWGWSEEQVLRAFRKNPLCMLISEKKITTLMDFFVDKMGLRPSDLSDGPLIWRFSLEKRIIPRVTLYQSLLSRGLVKKVKLSSLVVATEKKFLEKFVTPFAEKAPDLLKLYKETLTLSK